MKFWIGSMVNVDDDIDQNIRSQMSEIYIAVSATLNETKSTIKLMVAD